MEKNYRDLAIPADSITRVVTFAISQPDDVDINENSVQTNQVGVIKIDIQ